MTSTASADLDRQALIMLCAPTSIGGGSAPSFGPAAWHGLRHLLTELQMSPGDLLGMSCDDLVSRVGLTAEQADRTSRLLSRGGLVAIEMERLSSRGIWISALGDESYPPRLAARLVDQAPPLLFGAGNRGIASQDGLGIVGSRDADDDAIRYAEAVAASAVRGGLSAISGAARGVDAAAMNSAMEHGGSAVGVVADGLEKRIREPQVRVWLADERLCLLTPYGANTGFSVGAAMGRNKIIYGLASATVAVAATADRGGTWAGAVEALKAGWGPVFVLEGTEAASASRRLNALGAHTMPSEIPDELTHDVLVAWAGDAPSGTSDLPRAVADPQLSGEQFTIFGEPESVGVSKPKRVRRKAPAVEPSKKGRAH